MPVHLNTSRNHNVIMPKFHFCFYIYIKKFGYKRIDKLFLGQKPTLKYILYINIAKKKIGMECLFPHRLSYYI